MTDVIQHRANGARFAGRSQRTADVTNPATGEVTGSVVLADRADADVVIGAASAATRAASAISASPSGRPMPARSAAKPSVALGRLANSTVIA